MQSVTIEDKELGRLVIRVNQRARRLIFRTRPDAIYVSVPPSTTRKELDGAIEELRGRLLASQQKLTQQRIDLDYRIDTGFFRLTLVGGQQNKFLARSEPDKMQIVCPPDTNFENEELQQWLRKVVEESLRRHAKVLLPPRLQELSDRCGFSYKSVKINSSRGRWGSCSASGGINLSYFLLLLPPHLIDYVLLHELCHTQEMNHGDRFWRLLNKHAEDRALHLRQELKAYKTEV